MKNLTDNQRFCIVIVLMFIMFCAFTGYNSYVNRPVEKETHRLDSIGEDTIVKTQVMSFEYNGDKYIEFVRDDQSYVVHDPACKCMNNKLNNITAVINKNTNTHIAQLDANNRKNFRILIDKITELERKVNSIPRGYVPKPVAKKPTVTKKTPVKKAVKKK